MKLSEHFNLSEFTKHGEPPADALSLAAQFCREVLEPIRAKFGPVSITSGYRPPKANATAGGITDSQHVWTELRAAADFQVPGHHPEAVFEWICRESGLPVDQVILEYGANAASDCDDCIHASFRKGPPRQMAMIGETHGAGGYRQVPFIQPELPRPAITPETWGES